MHCTSALHTRTTLRTGNSTVWVPSVVPVRRRRLTLAVVFADFCYNYRQVPTFDELGRWLRGQIEGGDLDAITGAQCPSPPRRARARHRCTCVW